MLDVGTMPRSITVVLLNDLVDSCKVGFGDGSEYRLAMMLSSQGLCGSDGSHSAGISNARYE